MENCWRNKKKSPKYNTSQKNLIVTQNENNNKKISTFKNLQNGYLKLRIITETSQKGGASSSQNKSKKITKFPWKSISPPMKSYPINPHRKSNTICFKKSSKIKSSPKSKDHTQTQTLIKQPSTNSQDYKQIKDKKNKYLNHKQKQTMKKISNEKNKNKKNQLTNKKKIGQKITNNFDCLPPCFCSGQIDIIGVIGQGTFGQVFKGKLKKTGQIVAIKRILQDKKYINRQIQIVNMLQNDFIVNVIGTSISTWKGKQYLNIIMTYYDCDLHYYIKQHEKKRLPNFDIKIISYQIFRALFYIHSKGICHRDIKPHNILLKGKNAVICDFGSAKILSLGQTSLPYICSRCYRAPELIFGAMQYTTMIDIWSMGCVMLEMVNQIPLFIAENSTDHLIEIMKVMGTPTKSQVIDMNPQYELNDYKFPKFKKKQWNTVLQECQPLLLQLLQKIMIYSPNQRLSAGEAMAHEYFNELREEVNYSKIVKLTGIQHFFQFGEEELKCNTHLVSQLVPSWYLC